MHTLQLADVNASADSHLVKVPSQLILVAHRTWKQCLHLRCTFAIAHARRTAHFISRRHYYYYY